ncbi:MAG: FAD-dependent oxidoreductase [Nocardioidaceae bacterium]
MHKGGTTVFIRSKAQLARAHADVAAARAGGDTDADLRLLDAREASERAQATRLAGATFTPHCARVHPARLVRGLAEVVERRGVSIYERSAATSIAPSLVTTARSAESVPRMSCGRPRVYTFDCQEPSEPSYRCIH